MTYILQKKCFLIGIFGCAGAGKDTVGTYIEENYKDAYALAFADPLKQAAAVAFGIPVNSFYKTEFKILPHIFWNSTPRKIAQFFGTELFRDKIQELLPQVGNDFWIHRLAGTIQGELEQEGIDIWFDDTDTVVITDGRFNNELDFVLANGGIAIHLDRCVDPLTGGISNHPSEALNLSEENTSNLNYYALSNNSTLEDLYDSVENILHIHRAKISRKQLT